MMVVSQAAVYFQIGQNLCLMECLHVNGASSIDYFVDKHQGFDVNSHRELARKKRRVTPIRLSSLSALYSGQGHGGSRA